MKREIRWQPVSGLERERPLVLVDSKAWVMVRRADFPNACPFVIQRKEWDSLPTAQVGRNPKGQDRETGLGRNDEHAVPPQAGCARKDIP
jgi:hypothetical protein